MIKAKKKQLIRNIRDQCIAKIGLTTYEDLYDYLKD